MRDALDAIFQQNVGRLDVAMHQPLRVRRGQAGGDLHADPQDLRAAGSGPCSVEPLLQRVAARRTA